MQGIPEEFLYKSEKQEFAAGYTQQKPEKNSNSNSHLKEIDRKSLIFRGKLKEMRV